VQPTRRQKRYFGLAKNAVRQVSRRPGHYVYWQGGDSAVCVMVADRRLLRTCCAVERSWDPLKGYCYQVAI
jgi:hypothetical protein